MFKFLFRKDVNKLYAMRSIDGLAWSFVAIFIPVHLLQLGYSLREVFVYFIVQAVAVPVVSFLVLFLGRYMSFRNILLVRFPVLFLFLFMLYNLEEYGSLFYGLAAVNGAQIALLWIPIHVLFSHYAKSEKLGSSTANLSAIPKLVGMFGPMIGAFFIVNFGFKVLVLFSIFLFLLSFYPIFRARNLDVDCDFEMKDVVELYRKYKGYFLPEVCRIFGEEVSAVIWPLFIYVNLMSVKSVGVVGTLVAASSAIFILLVGRVSDKANNVSVIKTGALFISLGWLMIFALDGEFIYYVLTVLLGFCRAVFSVPYGSMFYEIAKKEREAVFFVVREIPVAIARILVFSVGILFFDDLKVLFLITALVYLFFIFWKVKGGYFRRLRMFFRR